MAGYECSLVGLGEREESSETSLSPATTAHTRSSKLTPHSKGLDSQEKIKLLDKPRITISIFIGLTLATLIVNIVWTSWAATHSTQGYGDSIVYRGDCSKAKNLKLWLHLLVNILSTVLVVGSSYCIQALSAPTRAEIDAAHAAGRSCRIGLLDTTNLMHITWLKRWTIFALAFSSLTIHVIYNATIINTTSTTSYSIFGVRPSFFPGAPFDLIPFDAVNSTINILSDRHNLSSFVRLSNQDCIRAYTEPLVSNYGDLFLVLDDSTIPENSSTNTSLLTVSSSCLGCAGSVDWLCNGVVPGFLETTSSAGHKKCTARLVHENLKNAESWTDTGGLLGQQAVRIQYCLSQPVPDRCAFAFSRDLMIVVIVWSAVKLVCMLIAAYTTSRSIMTVGDAIYSFLEEPAATVHTELDPRELEKAQGITGRLSHKTRAVLEQAYERLHEDSTPQLYYWYQFCSVRRYVFSFIWLLIVIALGAAFIGKTTADVGNRNYPTDFGHLITLGFGSTSGYELLHATATGVVGNSVIANLPQILLSMLYFCINGILSTQLASREWSRFGNEPRRLRTSFPSTEKMSFYLSMPYSYSGPLIVMFIFLHLGMSQSLFAVEIDIYKWDGSISQGLNTAYDVAKASAQGETVSTLCASTSAAIWSMMGLGIVVIVVVANCFRRMKVVVPCPCTQSIVVAAATHANIDLDEVLGKRLKWRRELDKSTADLMHLGKFEVE